MPFIDSRVSLSLNKEQRAEIVRRLGQAISILPGKSERYLMTEIRDNAHLSLAGDSGPPAAMISVSIFGSAGRADYDRLTAALCDIFSDVAKILPERTYVSYTECGTWGWNRENF